MDGSLLQCECMISRRDFLMLLGTTIFLPAAFKTTDPRLEFFELLKNDPDQERPQLLWSWELSAIASARAKEIALSGLWSHCNVDGTYCANDSVIDGGIQLPENYTRGRNDVESLVAGSPNVSVMFEALKNSSGHNPHMMGVGEHFRLQNWCGVGLYQDANTRYGWYYSILLTRLA